MSKKKAAGAPLWIVTFADLMSLLLTFFILLLSFSNMEVQEFKKVAGAMRSAFGLQSLDRLAGMIEIDGFTESTAVKHVVPIPIPEQDITDEVTPDVDDEESDAPEQTVQDLQAQASKKTFNDLETVLANEISADVMDLIKAGDSTVIRFPDKQTFASGRSDLLDQFLPVLQKVLDQLEKTQGNITISGHTDDIPITNDRFRSNWDLSSNRASSVAHYILQHTSITRDRITVQGYADSRPLVPNDSAENRAKNRRVEITIDTTLPSSALPDGASQDLQKPTEPKGEGPALRKDPISIIGGPAEDVPTFKNESEPTVQPPQKVISVIKPKPPVRTEQPAATKAPALRKDAISIIGGPTEIVPTFKNDEPAPTVEPPKKVAPIIKPKPPARTEQPAVKAPALRRDTISIIGGPTSVAPTFKEKPAPKVEPPKKIIPIKKPKPTARTEQPAVKAPALRRDTISIIGGPTSVAPTFKEEPAPTVAAPKKVIPIKKRPPPVRTDQPAAKAPALRKNPISIIGNPGE